MAWLTPITYVTGTVLTSSQMNTYVRDNLLATSPALVTTAGDMTYATGAQALTRLAAGSANQVLRVVGGIPTWTKDTFYGVVTTAGDFVYATAANTLTRLPIGSVNQVLQSNGTVPSWQNTSGYYSFMTTSGDLIYASAANTPARLGIGTTNQVLRTISGLPAWSTDASLNTFTTNGDLAVGTGSKALTRLAIGTNNQVLRTNLGATSPEWSSLHSQFIVGSTSNWDGTAWTVTSSTSKHLKIIIYLRSASANVGLDDLTFLFNSDTGNNYDQQKIIANNSTITASEVIGTNKGIFGRVPGGGLTDTGIYGSIVVYIPNFSNTTDEKVAYSQWSAKTDNLSTTLYTGHFTTYWRSTAAITTIAMGTGSNVTTVSMFEIYGLA